MKRRGGDCPYSDGKDATAFRERGPGLSAVTGDLAAFCETGHRAETVFLHLRGREREELYRTVAELAKGEASGNHQPALRKASEAQRISASDIWRMRRDRMNSSPISRCGVCGDRLFPCDSFLDYFP